MRTFLSLLLTLYTTLFLQAQTTLYQTDFSNTNDLTGTGSYSSELAQSDDFKDWMTASTYCVFENTGTLTLPSINIPTGSRMTITWGIHDSGRNIELKEGETTLHTFVASGADQLVESVFDFPSSFTGDKTLTLSINEEVVFITEILITSDNASGCSKNKLNSLNAWVEGKNLLVSTSVCDKIEVSSGSGTNIYKGDVGVGTTILPIALKSGIYFVKVGNSAIKLFVK